MSEAVKETVIETEGKEPDVITIDDSFIVIDRMEDTIISSHTDININIAQEKIINKESKDEIKQRSEDERELLVEQQYWEHQEYISKKLNTSKPNYTSCRRMTQRELNILDDQKTIARSPTYYQFDTSTTRILKMLQQKKIVGDYHNIVGHGKNSVVIHASCPWSARIWFSTGLAVKVYKLTNDSKHNDTILKRAQREYTNLLMLQNQHKACFDAIPCPRFVCKCKNVIVTDFDGFDQESAPSIASLPAEWSEEMYKKLVSQLYTLYNYVHLVHGRLSPRNILYIRNAPSYIGWGHSVRREHPMALRKLMKDCHFIIQFFRERGVPVMTEEQLMKHVTGLNNINRKLFHEIHDSDLWRRQHLTNPNRKTESPINNRNRNCRFK